MKRAALFLAAFAAASISVESNPRRMARPADQDDRAVFRRLQLRHHRAHRRRQNGRAPGPAGVVENRVGGSTIIGTDAVAKSAPDGYTLELANTTTHAASAALNATLPFDPVKDFAPVAMIGVSPFVLIGATQVAAPTLKDFVALAKAKPGSLSYASAGTGTLAHLAGELFKRKAGVDVTHVPYRGSAQSMIDLMQGRIDLSVSTIPPTLQHIREGKLRALATMSEKRNVMLPDIPTVAEAGVPGCEAALWTAIVVPAGVPADIIKRLNAAVLAAVADAGDSAGADDPGRRPGARPARGGQRTHQGRHREVEGRRRRRQDHRRAMSACRMPLAAYPKCAPTLNLKVRPGSG